MQNGESVPAVRRQRLVSARDVAFVLYFAALLLPAWLLAERRLPAVGRAIGRLTARLRRGRAPRLADRLRSLFGDRLTADAADVHSAIVANSHVHNMLYLRTLRPGGWKPSVRVVGAGHVRDALGARRGVVLWTAPFVYDGLVTKAGLAAADVEVGHLSHLFHFISGTRFGVRVLNGIIRAAENRYLAERFVMAPGRRTAALRGLRRRVEERGVVTVTAIGGSGGRSFTVPFLDGTLDLPAGAPELARRTDALLAAVSTIREKDDSFVTRIEPLVVASGLDKEAWLSAACTAFAALVGRWAVEHPDQCSPLLYVER